MGWIPAIVTGRVPPYDGLSRQQRNSAMRALSCPLSPTHPERPLPLSLPRMPPPLLQQDKHGMMGGTGIPFASKRHLHDTRRVPRQEPTLASLRAARLRVSTCWLFLFVCLMQPYGRGRPAGVEGKVERTYGQTCIRYQGGDVTRKCGQRKAQIRSEIYQGRKEEERPYIRARAPGPLSLSLPTPSSPRGTHQNLTAIWSPLSFFLSLSGLAGRTTEQCPESRGRALPNPTDDDWRPRWAKEINNMNK